MAASNVTVPGVGMEFEVDTNQYTATLQSRGGWVLNTHASEAAYINVDGGTVDTVQPVAGAGRYIKAGTAIQLPHTCAAFTFKAGAASMLQWTQEQPVV